MPFDKPVDVSRWKHLRPPSDQLWLYRGLGDASWELDSSFDRCCKREEVRPDHRKWFEDALLREFQRGYHLYDSRTPHPDHTLEWLSVMQHHGAPSRILDLSFSLYVAVHFAIDEAEEACAGRAIRAQWVIKQSRHLLKNGK